ncbi:MAG TPA: PHB depolymerase family esterase [Solirubrobacteraceae bacterium]|nr:PHB depolymerase family esterase [Solirubrobacteraceae bacterium]
MLRRFISCRLLGLCAILIALTAGCAPAAGAGDTQAGGAQAQPLGSGPCAQAGPAHDVSIALQSEGHARSAVLHLPRAASGRALALLVAFHGWGSSGAQFERETGLDALANRQGFAVLYPSSAGTSWRISGPPTDVAFTTTLLARVEALACIDLRRVYVTGLSNGAGMAARLACEASPLIAGVVPIAGYYGSLAPCEPAQPVSLLEIHGTDDAVVPYDSEGANGGGTALGFAAGWAARDGCAHEPTRVGVAPHAALYRWTGCAEGVRVEQLTLYGVGHGLPGAPGALVRAPGLATISGIGVVWSFLAPIVLAAPPA